MAEYIDRSELLRIEKLLDTDILRKSKTASNIYEQMMYDIAHIPAAGDVAPVKHGNWVNYAGKHDRGMDLRCSICNLRASYFVGGSDEWWDNSKPNYCPNCGAKMDLEG